MKHTLSYKHRGFSILELMVALLIGTILMGGAVSIFIGNKNTNRMVSELSRMQEAGRFIIDYMSKEIRLAGYYGCTSRFEKADPGTVKLNVMTRTASPYDFTDSNLAVSGLHGHNGEDRGQYDPSIIKTTNLTLALYEFNNDKKNRVFPGTDVINIQRANTCQEPLKKMTTTGEGAIFELNSNACKFEKAQTVMISDCKTADAFSIEDTANNVAVSVQHSKNLNEDINTAAFIATEYGTDAYASRLLSNTFFVGPTDRVDNKNIVKLALYVASWDPDDIVGLSANDYKVEELVEGIQDMQILYGVDTSGNEYVDEYLDASKINDWSDVRNVRVHVLMQSEDLITTEGHSFWFNGAEANPKNDRRLRLVFSTTVALRNRLQ